MENQASTFGDLCLSKNHLRSRVFTAFVEVITFFTAPWRVEIPLGILSYPLRSHPILFYLILSVPFVYKLTAKLLQRLIMIVAESIIAFNWKQPSHVFDSSTQQSLLILLPLGKEACLGERKHRYSAEHLSSRVCERGYKAKESKQLSSSAYSSLISTVTSSLLNMANFGTSRGFPFTFENMMADRLPNKLLEGIDEIFTLEQG